MMVVSFMKWPKTKITENEGLLCIRQLVNEHGDIFREIHLEEDIGIDAVIEFVKDNEASGRLLAIQIKSGESYVAPGKDKFVVPVDEAHLHYWEHYDLPVVLVCYSPGQKLAAWQDVKEYIQAQKRLEKVFPQEKVAIKSIGVPFKKAFNGQALSENLYQLTSEHADERLLFDKASMTLSSNAGERREGMLYIWLRCEKLATRLTAFLARQLILDENIDIVRIAASTLHTLLRLLIWLCPSPSPNISLDTAMGTIIAGARMRLIVKLDPKVTPSFCSACKTNMLAGFCLTQEIRPYPATLVYLFFSET